jgi:ABC-2 type transport system permease protein
MTNLVGAEWLKLRTTRLLFGIVPAAALLSFAAVAGSIFAADRAGVALDSARGIERVLPVTGAGALVVLLAGILISAGEYRHNTVSDTFMSTPRRHRVVVAKLTVGAAVGFGVGVISSAACVGLAALLFKANGATFPFTDADVWLTLAGTLVYTTLFAVLGVALGTMIRNQVLAVALALGWLAIVEHILVGFAPSIGRWLPAAAGQAIVRTPLEELLSPLVGAVVLVTYAAVIAAAGIRFAITRDT